MMKILVLAGICRRSGSLDICVPRAAAALVVLTLGSFALTGWIGYQAGERAGYRATANAETAELQRLLRDERRQIADAKVEQRAHLDALALRVADLQARVIRLDALGDRLVELGDLDKGEFNFTAEPPLGGTDEPQVAEDISPEDLGNDMVRIAALLEDREKKLLNLEQLLMTQDLIDEVTPSGRPVRQGWLSSGFGKRTDPFSGKKTFHRGVDFAGKPGTEVISVAAGVVTRSERTSGYGNVIEIRHANGYLTLYAHNKENLVSVGQVVGKGDTIALLGNTGRSSGPHVHLEVHRNGKIVNPWRFVR